MRTLRMKQNTREKIVDWPYVGNNNSTLGDKVTFVPVVLEDDIETE